LIPVANHATASEEDGLAAKIESDLSLTFAELDMFASAKAGKQGSPLAWWAPVALAAPALIPVARAYLGAYWSGRWPTGFVEYDMPVYMAWARQHFDQGFQLTYGNPYAPYGTPAIYSQPFTLLLGVLERLGLDPGLAFNLFGLAAIIFTVLVAIRFYRTLVGRSGYYRQETRPCLFHLGRRRAGFARIGC
jgi:hypothetical protein